MQSFLLSKKKLNCPPKIKLMNVHFGIFRETIGKRRHMEDTTNAEFRVFVLKGLFSLE